jgi:hypothetical protein
MIACELAIAVCNSSFEHQATNGTDAKAFDVQLRPVGGQRS